MDNKQTPDEQPKKKVAKKVIAQKRQYFMPEQGISVPADDSIEAAKSVAQKQEEEGDAK